MLLYYSNLYVILDTISIYTIGLMSCITYLNASLVACAFFDVYVQDFANEIVFFFFSLFCRAFVETCNHVVIIGFEMLAPLFSILSMLGLINISLRPKV